MSWTLIAVLIFIGLLFIVLEILVIPGQGIFGIIGLILMGIGIWQTYDSYGTVSGHIVLLSSFVISVISLIYSLRSNTWKKMTLKSEVDGRVNVIDEQKIKVGDIGKSISRLVPAGKALFNNEFYEVHTHGDFIDPQTEIEIISIDHSKIIVKQKN
jgi:membrane-bound ClpP family serine protease